MTVYRGKIFEWTYILDTFNNEIISSQLSSKQGDRKPYFKCLEDLKSKVNEQKEPTVLHTDQGQFTHLEHFSKLIKIIT